MKKADGGKGGRKKRKRRERGREEVWYRMLTEQGRE